MGDLFKQKFSSPDQKQLTIYISNINNFLGHALVETIRNDHLNDEAHHTIIGSLDPNENNMIPKGTTRIIDVFYRKIQINYIDFIYIYIYIYRIKNWWGSLKSFLTLM